MSALLSYDVCKQKHDILAKAMPSWLQQKNYANKPKVVDLEKKKIHVTNITESRYNLYQQQVHKQQINISHTEHMHGITHWSLVSQVARVKNNRLCTHSHLNTETYSNDDKVQLSSWNRDLVTYTHHTMARQYNIEKTLKQYCVRMRENILQKSFVVTDLIISDTFRYKRPGFWPPILWEVK